MALVTGKEGFEIKEIAGYVFLYLKSNCIIAFV
jgi:hypothetical protein